MVNKMAAAMPLNDVPKGSAAVLTIKFTALVLAFAMFALSSRHMDPAAFGTLAVTFSAMSFLAVISLCAQEALIVGLARGALTFGAQIAVITGLVTGVAVALGGSVWDPAVSTNL